jgi:hypothetical protein
MLEFNALLLEHIHEVLEGHHLRAMTESVRARNAI